MPVEVRPEAFSMVLFEPDEIRALVEKLMVEVGLPADAHVTIEVDETTAFGRAEVASTDPIVITAESGALEDAKRPRMMDPTGSADVLGKLLFIVRDRLDPAFADAPPEADLTLQESAAWETYAVGRLARLGHPGQRQRRLYQFRNRHGFTDVADTAFDSLWDAEGLTWADIKRTSDDALAAQPA
jgi:hypothetical protein